MSTAAPARAKTDWLVVLPDNVGALDQRLKVRPQHFAELSPKIENGDYKAGGALLEEPEREGESLKFEGSWILAKAETKEELMEILRKDIYVREGVWDLEKTKIYPVKTAFINP